MRNTLVASSLLASVIAMAIPLTNFAMAASTTGSQPDTEAPATASSKSSPSSTLKDVTVMIKESQALRQSAMKESNTTGRLKKLKEFETSLNAAIKSYEKVSPTEGGDAEEKVVKFSFRFEPIFEMSKKKFTKSDCDKAKGRIELEDQSGKPEGSPLSANAEEALKWLDLVCK